MIKIKESTKKVEEFVNDHFGIICVVGLGIFGTTIGIASYKQNQKFLDEANTKYTMYLIAKSASNNKNES